MCAQVKFEDSNIALLNSDLALEVRKAAAESEGQFEGAGEVEGIEIWRIEKFGIKNWPREQYGTFYSGDSYVVLHSYKSKGSEKLLYNVHFWLGSKTSQDEAGVAAWKTVELDDVLDQLPVQHRQVQGFETDEFLGLFTSPGMFVMDGGIESGFNVVGPTSYEPRLLHVKGVRNHVRVQQVPLKRDSLTQGDVFVLDNGLQLFQWNGVSSNVSEKRKAQQTIDVIRSERQGRPTFRVLDGDEECDAFWSLLEGSGAIRSAEEAGDDNEFCGGDKRVMRLSDESGTLTLNEVAKGEVSFENLDTQDIFIVDDGGVNIFVWVGDGASRDERAKAFLYANKYIVENELPLTIPVCRVTEGNTSPAFNAVFE